MAQSDSIFDLIDPKDHQILKEILLNKKENNNNISFICRWKSPKLGGITKRQPDWNGKVFIFN
ncbi:BHLH domain-containing protein [Meloidogyne graminicola]|uniref:BHLH domain-containing protein n=1 Tax=Meloidogyne graminicola TaxID=189291 RepID=A0A8T0A0J1_9BILA|nr:BHLH domain-containing protein [Meloidogyne graminicola]